MLHTYSRLLFCALRSPLNISLLLDSSYRPSRWAFLQQPSTKQAIQECLISAAATTGTLPRKGVEETKDKVAVGKTKVEEVVLAQIACFFWYLIRFLVNAEC